MLHVIHWGKFGQDAEPYEAILCLLYSPSKLLETASKHVSARLTHLMSLLPGYPPLQVGSQLRELWGIKFYSVCTSGLSGCCSDHCCRKRGCGSQDGHIHLCSCFIFLHHFCLSGMWLMTTFITHLLTFGHLQSCVNSIVWSFSLCSFGHCTCPWCFLVSWLTQWLLAGVILSGHVPRCTMSCVHTPLKLGVFQLRWLGESMDLCWWWSCAAMHLQVEWISQFKLRSTCTE